MDITKDRRMVMGGLDPNIAMEQVLKELKIERERALQKARRMPSHKRTEAILAAFERSMAQIDVLERFIELLAKEEPSHGKHHID